ncbi:hypothetical protein BH09GEM1_BH09GEM1_05930 [soil metagenome]
MTGALLFAVYVATAAPGLTFWDAGEFIAAAHTFGIPHPPGTPLFVAAGRSWTLVFGWISGVARALNLLSSACTAMAGAIAVLLIGRGAAERRDVTWGAMAAGLGAGLMASVWANATETEVYAASLLIVATTLYAAQRASTNAEARQQRWVLLTGYLIALAPAVHLSALVGAPAAVVLASRDANGTWRVERVLLLGGALFMAAGLGRMSYALTGIGALMACLSAIVRTDGSTATRRGVAPAIALVALAAIASSALLILLVRAQHDPLLNQGDPASLTALADVVARRQYDVAPMWPRRAPAWIQLATLVQYVDWQVALAWGNGIFTTPVRVGATILFLVAGVSGWRALRRDVPRVAAALGVLLLCGSLGVCTYLNLKAGATIGYGIVPDDAHEARERDYFFVLGFWAWGLFAGYGSLSMVRARSWPPWAALSVAIPLLAGNWAAEDRAHGVEATAPREVAVALLTSSPKNAVLFVAGDNDTYPLWYLQAVEGIRTDVTVVTFPLLPADWYAEEIGRRTGLRWPAAEHVEGAKWQHEERAALIARAARTAGRPVSASAALTARERAFLGSGWRLNWAVYVSSLPAGGSQAVVIDTLSAPPGWKGLSGEREAHAHLADDVSAAMLALLECPGLARMPKGQSTSLESKCNVR